MPCQRARELAEQAGKPGGVQKAWQDMGLVPSRVKQEERLRAVAAQREGLDSRVAAQELSAEQRLDALDAALQVRPLAPKTLETHRSHPLQRGEGGGGGGFCPPARAGGWPSRGCRCSSAQHSRSCQPPGWYSEWPVIGPPPSLTDVGNSPCCHVCSVLLRAYRWSLSTGRDE